MRRIIILVLLLGFSLGSFGCKSRIIKEPGPEEMTLPLTVLEQLNLKESKSGEATLPLSVLEQLDLSVVASFIPLIDKRPQEDIAFMTSVREKVSSKILESLQSTGVFDQIHFPANNEDVLMLSGEIRRFGWVSFDTMISYIPGLNVLPFFGLPSNTVKSDVEIYLELKNANTDEVIFKFSESYSKTRKYNIYNFTQDKAEGELAYCFDVALARIKEKVAANRNKVFKTAMIITLEAARKKYEAEVAASGETKEAVAAKVEPTPPEKTEIEPVTEIKKAPSAKAGEEPSVAVAVPPASDKIEGVSGARIEETQGVEATPEEVKDSGAKIEEKPTVVEGVPETTEKAAEVMGTQKEEAVQQTQE